MSFFVNLAAKGMSTGFSLAKTAAFGGLGQRVALGAAGGALYGMATNQYDNTEMAMGHVLRSAFLGSALGGVSRLFTPKHLGGMRFSGTPLGWKAVGSAFRHGSRPGMRAIDSAATAVGWGIAHPLAATAIVGGAYAINEMNKSPYDSPLSQSTVNRPIEWHGDLGRSYSNRIDSEEQMLVQMNRGVAPMSSSSSGTKMRYDRMHQSTFGLTQGLHSGRHG